MLKKVAYSKEPILKVHRYVVVVGTESSGFWKAVHHYAMNLKEAREIANKAPKTAIVELYRARHDFIQAYQRL